MERNKRLYAFLLPWQVREMRNAKCVVIVENRLAIFPIKYKGFTFVGSRGKAPCGSRAEPWSFVGFGGIETPDSFGTFASKVQRSSTESYLLDVTTHLVVFIYIFFTHRRYNSTKKAQERLSFFDSFIIKYVSITSMGRVIAYIPVMAPIPIGAFSIYLVNTYIYPIPVP